MTNWKGSFGSTQKSPRSAPSAHPQVCHQQRSNKLFFSATLLFLFFAIITTFGSPPFFNRRHGSHKYVLFSFPPTFSYVKSTGKRVSRKLPSRWCLILFALIISITYILRFSSICDHLPTRSTASWVRLEAARQACVCLGPIANYQESSSCPSYDSSSSISSADPNLVLERGYSLARRQYKSQTLSIWMAVVSF